MYIVVLKSGNAIQIYSKNMNIKLHDFMYFLHENKMIDVTDILSEDETGCINRLKLQKYFTFSSDMPK
jgi:hypothetical protein